MADTAATSPGVLRTVAILLTGTFALLQVLDVLADRLGLPERVFTQVVIGALLLLPAAVAWGVLRKLGDDDAAEDAGWGGGSAVRQRSGGAGTAAVRAVPGEVQAAATLHDAGRRGAPETATAPADADPAVAHFRLAELYRAHGDEERAIYHYTRYLELHAARGGDTPRTP